jgi:uncharacterized protein YigA (DUF484 family)
MSTQPRPNYTEEEPSETEVRNYLVAHPDFFDRNAKLLSQLDLPHSSGAAVSLVERQVAVLRQKDMKRERQFRELIEVARANDLLAAKIHELTKHLLAASSLQATIVAVEQAMRSGFDADQAVLVIFGDPDRFDDISAGRFFHVIDRKDASLKPFNTFLNGNGPRCGQIRDTQREFLFHNDAEEIGSAALVPLGKGAEIGFLAVGSNDTRRFHPAMSMDFLTRLGDLIAGALKRY